jgi:16S rRNA (guanine527-N7)-methyltransferase
VGAHGPPLLALGVDAPAVRRLASYLDLLAAWSRRVNLTAAATPERRVEVLVAPVLPALPRLAPGGLIDVGSGNGSPGLVIALLDPSRRVTLLEPRARRWAFLREAARAAGRDDVRVLKERHDAYAGPPAANVTVRALRLPLAALRPLVAADGRVLVFGPEPAPDAGWRRLDLPGPSGPAAFAPPPSARA